jgi:serine/threonine protein kinase
MQRNVLIDAAGRARLAEFDLSMYNGSSSSPQVGYSTSGRAARYLAPEFSSGEGRDWDDDELVVATVDSDVFSLGILTFEVSHHLNHLIS